MISSQKVILAGEVQRQYAIKLISEIEVPGYMITIEPYIRKRSLNQNSLFHKWCQEIGDFVGDTPNNVKEDLKRMFSPRVEKISKLTGEITYPPKGTSEMDVREMSEFMEKVQAFAASDLGLRLTSPEDR